MNNFRPYSSRAMQSNCREQRPYQFFKIFLPSKTRDEKLVIKLGNFSFFLFMPFNACFLLYLGSSSLSSIDCLYESATCKEQAGGPAVVCRSASPMAKSVLVSENPFVFRVFEMRTFFAEEVPLYILHIRGLSFRLLWEEDHVDCRRGISSLLFRKGNPHFKEGFC